MRVVIKPDTGRPITPVTLRKYFRAELDRGLIQTKMRVGGALVRAALGVAPTEHHAGYAGNVTAQIFYLKTQAGWKEGEPPLPSTPDEEVDMQDAGRRIAFALAAAEREPKALPKPKSKEPA